MPEQLTFDLPVRTSRRRGDFFVSDANALAVARLDAPETWPNGKLVLFGPEGSGKSHLAHIWAEANGTVVSTPGALLACDIPEIDLPVAVDKGDGSPLGEREEEALFHLHNHLAAHSLPLLLIARQPPALWSLALPDLKSRMEATDSVRIDEPDDALLSALIVKLFADRQIEVTPALITWMVPRIDRSFAAAQTAVAALDDASLELKRPITRDLARRILDKRHSKAP